MSHRTLTEILTDMDNAECLNEIEKLNREVFSNKYKYSLCELEYCNEHTVKTVKEIARKDAQELKKILNI